MGRIIEVAAGPDAPPAGLQADSTDSHVSPAVAEFFCPKDDRVIESALSVGSASPSVGR